MSDQRRTELSNAGARRRDQMLPLLQEAMRERVRRRRQRRALVCSVLAVLVTIGLVEVFELRSPNRQAPEGLVADRGPNLAPTTSSDAEIPARPAIDIQSFDPSTLYAQLIERDPDILITTPTELRADQRTSDTTVVVAIVTTDQLMMELAMAGMDSAVVCSADACTLFTTTPARDEERTLRKREL